MAIVTATAILIRDELLPTLEARPASQARVAANALEIVARKLTHAHRANAEEAARLGTLLGKPGELAALNRPLWRCIAAGARKETAAAAARMRFRSCYNISPIRCWTIGLVDRWIRDLIQETGVWTRASNRFARDALLGEDHAIEEIVAPMPCRRTVLI